MTPARAEANRRNARRSTGPRTREGMARVARNALRHGLAVPVAALPEYDDALKQLTTLIVGEDADAARLEAARRVAEATVDLRRIHTAKLALMESLEAPKLKAPRSRPSSLHSSCASIATNGGRCRGESRRSDTWMLSARRLNTAIKAFGHASS